MAELLTAAQMRAIEGAAIKSGAVTGEALMERAGRGVLDAVFAEWPELGQGAHRAVVLCGPGNNGGDGFVIARLLRARGWDLEVFLYGDAENLPPDAKTNHMRWAALGDVQPLEDVLFDAWADEWSGVSVVFDALFGTGLVRPFLAFRRLSMALNACAARARMRGAFPRVVAVDIPSGLCADSGKWLGYDQQGDVPNPANLTVSFHSLKIGHVLRDGPASCGKTVVASIGLAGSGDRQGDEMRGPLRPENGRSVPVVPPAEIVHLAEFMHAVRHKEVGGHKYAHGHALILSGGAGRTGAARMAARGAIRIGAGLVTLGVPGSAQLEVAAQVTAVMLTRIEDADGLAAVLKDARVNALCLGPGLGIERARTLVPAALAAGRATVLDADAITAFADAPEALFDALHDTCVLTPHAGEFRRLFPDIAEKLDAPAATGPAYSKVDATRAAARRAGCTVLFKGPDTVIANPCGKTVVNAAVYDRAAPWLATAGAGDVLAGFITGLLARGFVPCDAAACAAWLHVEAARRFGPGLVATDLPECLPAVLADLR
jgi:hydroxyethylthiazole kinase-like uncharacterized protein yjeF